MSYILKTAVKITPAVLWKIKTSYRKIFITVFITKDHSDNHKIYLSSKTTKANCYQMGNNSQRRDYSLSSMDIFKEKKKEQMTQCSDSSETYDSLILRNCWVQWGKNESLLSLNYIK